MAKVVVFCSSKDSIAPAIKEEARLFGKALAEAGHELVYGGAKLGAMGLVADGCLSAGGKVTGIFAKKDLDFEQPHSGLTQMIDADSMSARKQKLTEIGEAFVIFPGGTGTLDEFYEVLVLKQIAAYKHPKPKIGLKPMILFNLLDVWKPLLELMEVQKAQGLVDASVSELYDVTETIEETMGVLNEAFK
ncbi:MAG: TIGR00730 family Rossman fold protein [Pseudomonadota bacterium]